jgi:hypothetical protein
MIRMIFRERKRGGSAIGRVRGKKTSIEVLRTSRDTQAQSAKKPQGDKLAGVTSL